MLGAICLIWNSGPNWNYNDKSWKSCKIIWEMSLECCAHNMNELQILSSENNYVPVTRNNNELCLFITLEFVQVILWKRFLCTSFENNRATFVTELGSMLWHWNIDDVNRVSCFLVSFTQFPWVPSVENMTTNLNHFQSGIVHCTCITFLRFFILIWWSDCGCVAKYYGKFLAGKELWGFSFLLEGSYGTGESSDDVINFLLHLHRQLLSLVRSMKNYSLQIVVVLTQKLCTICLNGNFIYDA